MKQIWEYTRAEYIDWLQAYKNYSYQDAVKIADLMQVK